MWVEETQCLFIVLNATKRTFQFNLGSVFPVHIKKSPTHNIFSSQIQTGSGPRRSLLLIGNQPQCLPKWFTQQLQITDYPINKNNPNHNWIENLQVQSWATVQLAGTKPFQLKRKLVWELLVQAINAASLSHSNENAKGAIDCSQQPQRAPTVWSVLITNKCSTQAGLWGWAFMETTLAKRCASFARGILPRIPISVRIAEWWSLDTESYINNWVICFTNCFF